MIPADQSAAAQTETLTLEFELNHSPAKVWRALTTPEHLSEWLLPVANFQLQPGAQFTFRAPQSFADWDGKVSCRMVEIESHRKLSYTWDVPFLQTVVTFELTPTETGTRLSVVQSGFKPGQKRELGGARYGWRMMGERLVELLDRMDHTA